MTRFQFEEGNRFLIGEVQWLLVEFLPNQYLVLMKVVGGERKVIPTDELARYIYSGEAVLIKDDVKPSSLNTSPLDFMSEFQRTEIERRYKYVNELEKISIASGVVSRFAPLVIREISQQIDDLSPPSPISLYRWHKRWRVSGKSLEALAPRTHLRGKREKDISNEVREIVFQLLNEHYLVREQPTLKKIIRTHIKPHFKCENAKRSKQDQLKLPSQASIYRVANEIDPYFKVLKREGKQAAEARFRIRGAGIKVEAPLDCVLFDHTEINLCVVAPNENFFARPTLTVGIDLYSRMIWGAYLGFAAPGYESVMMCIHSGIKHKADTLSKLATVNGTWPCHGLPRQAIVDNGAEFHSESLRDAARLLGIGITYCPVRQPEYKAVVERVFKSLNTGLLAGLPGYTFPDHKAKGDYDTGANAVIPFEEFYEAFYKWLIDCYSRDFHTEIDDFPIERWTKGVEKYPVDLPTKMEDLHILLGEPLERTLTKWGIKLHCRRYNCEELGFVYRRTGKKKKVWLKLDPTDIGHIYVYDDIDQKYITVPCLDPDLFGMSKWQFKLIRKAVAAKRRRGEDTYNVGEELRNIHDQLNKFRKKRRSNKSAARHSEYEKNKKERTKSNASSKPNSPNGGTDTTQSDLDDLLKSASKRGWGKTDKWED